MTMTLSKREKATVDKALAILEKAATYGELLTSPATSANMFKTRLGHREVEVFCVAFLTAQHETIEVREMFSGSISESSVYPRVVAKLALELNAAAVILAHNHPSGMAKPSASDVTITHKLKEALGLFDIRVLDHIVVAGADHVSLAEQGDL